ncbi:MAG: hypothetical protein ABIG08_02410 [bacterium]
MAIVLTGFLFLAAGCSGEEDGRKEELFASPTPESANLSETTEEEFCSSCHQDLVEAFVHNLQRHPFVPCHNCHKLHGAKEAPVRCEAGFGYKWICPVCHTDISEN